jgi:cyanophycinase
MNGLIALVGSGEYLPVMNDVDAHLLAGVHSNGRKPRVVCLPTAAGREGDASVNRWSTMGVEHFTRLGADVQAVPVIDKKSANETKWASAIEEADLIYFSGGNPHYLYETMQGSRAWDAAQKAWGRGAVYAGCSAGAMILGRQVPNFRMPGRGPASSFGILPAQYIIPHFDAIPAVWKPLLFAMRQGLSDGEFLLGVDENTALVGKLGGAWTVMGRSKVHVFRKDESRSYPAGEIIEIQ